MRVERPGHLHNCYVSFFEPLLLALKAANSKPLGTTLAFVRRSLEWFFHAHSTQENVSDKAGLVLLCLAMDAAMCGSKGQRDFADNVSSIFTSRGYPRRTHAVWYWRDNAKRNHSLNILGAWAWEFYGLRNSLVHSDMNSSFSTAWRRGSAAFSQSVLASYAWFECLWDTLGKCNAIPPEPVWDANDPVKPWKWHHTWQRSVESMRDNWYVFITGRSRRR